MPEQPPSAAPQPPSGQRRGRRFRSLFCRFHAIGSVSRPPTYHRSKRGHASAVLSILTDEDRDLDLIVFDRDEASLRQRLQGLETGARVYAEGAVQGPRLSQRELPQFVAEVIFHTTSNGPRPVATSRPGATLETP